MNKLTEMKFDVIELKEIWSHYLESSSSKWTEGGDARASVVGPYIIALALLIPILFLIFD
ncbi:MAG: hypothetical protein ABFR19_05015 [Pseudomonadota bacterium]